MKKADFRILIADDDEITRDVIATLLSREGYRTCAVKDGIEAIRVLRIENIALVITDLRMTGADGIEVLKHAVRINPDVAVVILTAFSSLETTLEAVKEGAYDYLTKPFSIQQILILVERAFKRAILIGENKELSKCLRDTYREVEIARAVVKSNSPEITASWLERLERLKELHVLTIQEADILKERLIRGNGKG